MVWVLSKELFERKFLPGIAQINGNGNVMPTAERFGSSRAISS
jgi:hypothetical protein